MTESVASGEEPHAGVDGKPTVAVVLCVAVTRRLVPREDVLQVAVGEDPAVGGADDHHMMGGRIDPVTGPITHSVQVQ